MQESLLQLIQCVTDVLNVDFKLSAKGAWQMSPFKVWSLDSVIAMSLSQGEA